MPGCTCTDSGRSDKVGQLMNARSETPLNGAVKTCGEARGSGFGNAFRHRTRANGGANAELPYNLLGHNESQGSSKVHLATKSEGSWLHEQSLLSKRARLSLTLSLLVWDS
eukprot:4664634-Amphidinium_carterae.1